MRRLRRFLPWLGLALILLTATRVRWLSYALPSVPSEASDFFRDDHGDPYFADPDSYYYLRKAEELAGTGGSLLSEARESDRLIGGRQAESAGSHGTLMGLPALTYLVWRLLSLFSALSLSQLALRLAPVVSALSALPPFLFLRKRAGAVPALTASALAAFAVPFASHACVGFFDTDMVLGVLPLAVMLGFLRCLEEENVRKQLGFALLSASALALMSLFWQFYSLYLALPLCCGVFCLLFSALERGLRQRHRGLPSAGSSPLRRMARGWLFCAGLMGGFLLMLHGPGLFSSLAGIAQLAPGALGASGADSAFLPDPSRYIVEMQPVPALPSPGGGIAEWIVAGRSSLLSLLGGLPVCLAVLLSVPAEAAAIRLGRKTSSEGTALAFLAAWLLATLPPALAHHRFAQLAVLPAAMLAGLFVARVGDLPGRLRLPQAGRALLSALLALGLTNPARERGALLGGAALVICCGAWLWLSRPRKSLRAVPSGQLMQQAGKAERAGARVVFAEDGMSIRPARGGQELIPYDDLLFAFELNDLLVLTGLRRAVALQTLELSWGDWEEFRAFLTQRIDEYVDLRRRK